MNAGVQGSACATLSPQQHTATLQIHLPSLGQEEGCQSKGQSKLAVKGPPFLHTFACGS